MDIAFDKKEALLVVKLKGEIDHHSCEYIRQRADKAFIEERLMNMELDFSKVSFMDSSAIGLIMGRKKLVESLGGEVFVTGLNDRFLKMLKLSGIDRVVKISGKGDEFNG